MRFGDCSELVGALTDDDEVQAAPGESVGVGFSDTVGSSSDESPGSSASDGVLLNFNWCSFLLVFSCVLLGKGVVTIKENAHKLTSIFFMDEDRSRSIQIQVVNNFSSQIAERYTIMGSSLRGMKRRLISSSKKRL